MSYLSDPQMSSDQLEKKSKCAQQCIPVAHSATKVCACFLRICLVLWWMFNLDRKCSMKSWGVTDARSHFSLLRTTNSICYTGKTKTNDFCWAATHLARVPAKKKWHAHVGRVCTRVHTCMCVHLCTGPKLHLVYRPVEVAVAPFLFFIFSV